MLDIRQFFDPTEQRDSGLPMARSYATTFSMRSLSLLALCSFAVVVFAACRDHQPSQSARRLFDESPEAVVKRYLDARFHGPPRVVYECATSADRAAMRLEVLEQQDSQAASMLGSFATYEIKDVQTAGDTATAVIDVTTPDYGQLDLDWTAIARLNQTNNKEAQRVVLDAVQKVPKVTTTQRLQLRHESDGRKVDMNWAAAKRR